MAGWTVVPNPDPTSAWTPVATPAPSITDNPRGEGTYAMWNDRGQKLGIPYSQVPVAQQKGYQFDTNPAQSGLTPAQQFIKDQAADKTRTGGTSLAMRSNPSQVEDATPGTGMNLVAGVAKGAGTLATPVLDLGNLIAKHTGGNPVDINKMLAAHGASQTIGKLGTIGATIAPAAVLNPAGTALALGGGAVGGTVGHVVGNAAGMSPEATALLSDAGGLAGGIGGAKLAAPIASALAPDADAAALRGLQIGPKSPKALSTLSAVDNARPFLQGSQDLADIQSRIAPAKAEIWKPYQQAIDAIGNRPVQGPDGMTTVGELENQRLQLSALNRGLKQQLPEAIQVAQQKGMTAAQLLDQERAVKSALDPELESTGINPQLIRKVFGSVSQVGQRVSGKSTLIEPTQPSGLGKIANLSIKQPLQAPAQIASGLRDLLAGRPLYAAKPTDLGIREGFANAGPKPDFGTPTISPRLADILRRTGR